MINRQRGHFTHAIISRTPLLDYTLDRSILKKIKTIIVVCLLALSILACQVTAGPKPPRGVTINAEQAQALAKALQNPEMSSTGVITVRITESQLTSYLILNMGKEVSEFLSNPVVLFEPNQVHLYGTLKGDVFPVDGRIIAEIALVNKLPQVSIVSADFGFLPVPAALLSSLAEQINKAITREMSQSPQNYQVQSIVLTAGLATIQMVKK